MGHPQGRQAQISEKASFGSDPPRLGSRAGALPLLASIEPSAQVTHGSSTGRRVAMKPRTLSPGAPPPWGSRGRRDGRGRSRSAPAIPCRRRSAVAGRLRMGRHGVDRPVRIAGAEGQHFEGVPPEDPLGGGEARLAPIFIDGRRGRISADADVGQGGTHAGGIGGGRRPGTRMVPRPSTSEAMALASTVPGLRSRPPQLPEWWPPSRSSTASSKLMRRVNRGNSVGRSALRRGPSDAISTSAASASACSRQKGRRPGEPNSSPISTRNVTLKPGGPCRDRIT